MSERAPPLIALGTEAGLSVWSDSASLRKPGSRDSPSTSSEEERARLIVLGVVVPSSRPALDPSRPEVPTAIAASAVVEGEWPVFPNVAVATTFLAMEVGGDDELAALWLDLSARLLGDPGVLIPPPPRLRVARADDDLAVLSLPLEAPSFDDPGAEDSDGFFPRLTRAEQEIVAGLREGLSNAEIARRRGRAQSTVARQLAQLYRKLGVGSRAEAIHALGLSGNYRD